MHIFRYLGSTSISMEYVFHIWRHWCPSSSEGLGASSDVASDCVALITKIKMADDSSPALSEKKRPLTDDTKGLSADGGVEQKEYQVSLFCYSSILFLVSTFLTFRSSNVLINKVFLWSSRMLFINELYLCWTLFTM